MPEDDHCRTDAGPCWQTLIEQWSQCVREARTTARHLSPSDTSGVESLPWRRLCLDGMARATDEFLRSPPFLQGLRAHLDALVAARRDAGAPTAVSAELADLPAESHPAAMVRELDRLDASFWAALEAPGRSAPDTPQASGLLTAAGRWKEFLKAYRMGGPTGEEPQGVTPHEVIYQEGPLRLLRYQLPDRWDQQSAKVDHSGHDSSTAAAYVEPVLVCFSLVNRPYILDIEPGRSVIRALLDQGLAVYLIDWGSPRPADHALRLSDYVCGFLHRVAAVTCRDAGAPTLSLLGYCMGGTMSTLYAALHPERVRNLILMAAPIDFSGQDGLLNVWSREEHFDVDKLIDAYGNLPGEFLQYCFQWLRPVENLAEKYLKLCERLEDTAFLENFLAMERWANDSIPIAGETFRDFVKLLYQQNRLIRGELILAGRPVRLDAITCPVLLLVAQQDHLVPPDSTTALGRHVDSTEIETLCVNAGHIGLAVSRRAHQDLWPAAARWIVKHCTRNRA